MDNDELLNYISMFREKAEQGKLVIFVGAGVSLQCRRNAQLECLDSKYGKGD